MKKTKETAGKTATGAAHGARRGDGASYPGASGAATVAAIKPDALAVYPLDEGAGLSVKIDGETVWLTQKQMAVLFGCDRANVAQHLRGIYADGELDAVATCKDFLQVQDEGGRQVSREVAHYNLDAVISVGFRVNSRRGIAFRQWANGVIRERMMSRLSPSAVRMQRREDTRRLALTRSKSAATCLRCLFGRLVSCGDRGTVCECHVSRPTREGFPVVRPDDFCAFHVSIRARRRTFEGLGADDAALAPTGDEIGAPCGADADGGLGVIDLLKAGGAE